MERSRSIDDHVGGKKMMGKDWNSSKAGITIAALAIFIVIGTFSAAGQAWSAEITPGLSETIAREVSDQHVRGQILDNLSRSLEKGLSTDTMELYVNRLVEGGVSPSVLERLTRALARTLEDDLPSGPVVVKVLEGVAKNVPGERWYRCRMLPW